MIDTNVTLHRWPFRRVAGDDPADLLARLNEKGVTQAWAGSFESLLHRDISAVNARLIADCQKYGPKFLLPFGSINPKLPDWQEDLRRCCEEYGMAGVRLHPNYHGYTLEDPVCLGMFSMAARYNLVVQIALSMEDERTQYPLMRVPPVDPSPLPGLIRQSPNLRILLLNGTRTTFSREIAQVQNICFDISNVEGVGGVSRLISETSVSRVVFGSHFPLFYFESALLKIREAALSEDQAQAVSEGNARALLGKVPSPDSK